MAFVALEIEYVVKRCFQQPCASAARTVSAGFRRTATGAIAVQVIIHWSARQSFNLLAHGHARPRQAARRVRHLPRTESFADSATDLEAVTGLVVALPREQAGMLSRLGMWKPVEGDGP